MFYIFLSLLTLVTGSAEGTMNSEFICLQKTELAQKVTQAFKKPLHEARFRKFADGEINVELQDSSIYAGKTVIIIQSASHPVNEHTLGISFLAYELQNAGAARVIGVIPYFGYSRQEKSSIAGKPGHAAVIAKLFESAGIDELFVVDLHDEALLDFFSIPIHNLSAQSIIAQHIKEYQDSSKEPCLVAPDKGAADYVEAIAMKIDVGTLIFSKERFAIDQTRITGSNGDCRGTTGIIIDDIMATGGTAINVADALHDRGYKKIYGYFVHPVFAGDAIERIQESSFNTIYVSNTLPLPAAAQNKPFIKQFDVSNIIIKAVQKYMS